MRICFKSDKNDGHLNEELSTLYFSGETQFPKSSLFDWNVTGLPRWPRRYKRHVHCLFSLTASAEYCGPIISTRAPKSGGHGSYVRPF